MEEPPAKVSMSARNTLGYKLTPGDLWSLKKMIAKIVILELFGSSILLVPGAPHVFLSPLFSGRPNYSRSSIKMLRAPGIEK